MAKRRRVRTAKPEKRVATTGLHRGEPAEPRPPEQVDQKRLGLIIGGVTSQRVASEHTPPSVSRPCLEIAPGGNLDTLAPKLCPVSCSDRSHHHGIVTGIRTKAVVDMDRGDVKTGSNGQDQQRQRVCTARDGAHDR